MDRSNEKNYLTIDEFLQLAILFESEAAEFYHSFQKATQDDTVRALLELLEDEEKEHERILRDRKMQLDLSTMLQFSPSLILALPEPTSQNPGYDEMLSIAIEREIIARKIYEAAAELVSDDFKKLLHDLAAFEREHEKKLSRLKTDE